MNLAPSWVPFFAGHHIEALHWSAIGDPKARDVEIMEWARAHGCVVFTHDLDYSSVLANAALKGPSLVQVRTQNVLPDAIGERVIGVLLNQADALAKGAVVTIDEMNARVRVLPIRARY
jgi:predicted nuclease of predicted toxin-antitoxin system